MEQWRDIEGYSDLYMISDHGRVMRIGQDITRKDGAQVYYPTRLLKPRKNSAGYLRVQLCRNGRPKWFFIHRLVAEAFCGGYFEGAEVNHKDENKENNHAMNLEWCTPSYNCSYGSKPEATRRAHSKMVVQYSLSGERLRYFPSTHSAARETGCNQGHIASVCNGRRETTGGYIWKYAGEY